MTPSLIDAAKRSMDTPNIARTLLYGSEEDRCAIIDGFRADHLLESPVYEALFTTLFHWNLSSPLPHDMTFCAEPSTYQPDIDSFLTRITQRILEARPDWVNTLDHLTQRTPLMIALGKGYSRLCDCLMEKGADIHQKNLYGESTLERAINGRCTLEYKLYFLERYEASGGIDPDQMFLGFVRAAEHHDPTLCDFFFARGADDCRDGDGKTAIMVMLEAVDLEAVDILMNRGCSLTPLDYQGRSALHYLAQTGEDTDKAEALAISFLQAGMDPELGDKNGDTPLDIAEQSGQKFMKRAIEWTQLRKHTPHKTPGRPISRL